MAETTQKDKDKIIKEVYFDSGALGSIKRTLEDARKKDPSIKEADVKSWKDRNLRKKINVSGFNSWVASEPKEEYQMDLFKMPVAKIVVTSQLTEKQREEREQKQRDQRNLRRRVGKRDLGPGVTGVKRGVKGKEIEVEKMPKNAPMPFGLLIVDIFTKYVNVVPLFDNQGPNVVAALKEGLRNMGGKPKTIYCDGEGGFVGKDMQEYLLKENIRMINSRNHAPYAERHIRTIKDMINRRLEYKKLVTKKWVDILPDILKEYNNKMVHSSHKFTPEQARQRRNEATIKGRLEVKRISDRKYPEVEEGDTVRVFKSKDKMSKQNVPVWSETLHKVVRIQETHGQKVYTVDPVAFQWRRPLVRSDILSISKGKKTSTA